MPGWDLCFLLTFPVLGRVCLFSGVFCSVCPGESERASAASLQRPEPRARPDSSLACFSPYSEAVSEFAFPDS